MRSVDPPKQQSRFHFLQQLPKAYWVIAFTCAISLTLLLFVDTYAYNLIYHDQWDLYNPMFSESGIANAFLYQHGPHRQGIGGIVTYLLAGETNFSIVAESYMIACVLIGTAFLTLSLKRKLGYKFTYSDIALSLIILNPVQFETITSVPNVSHSILPLLLLILVARTWISSNHWVQYIVSSIIAGLALFTGFGIFVWIAFFGLLAWDAIQTTLTPKRPVTYLCLIGIGIMLLFLWWFMVNYRLHPTESSTSSIHEPVSDYLIFTNHVFGRVFYLAKSIRPYIGFLTLILVSTFAFHSLKRKITNFQTHKLHDICILFFVTSFSYIAVTAIGRVAIGASGGGSSRYMSLTLPCFIAVYFILITWRQNKRKHSHALQLTFVVFCLLSHVSNSFYAHSVSEEKLLKKQEWVEAFHESGDIMQATIKSDFFVYPDESKIRTKIEYLRANQLNLFDTGE